MGAVKAGGPGGGVRAGGDGGAPAGSTTDAVRDDGRSGDGAATGLILPGA